MHHANNEDKNCLFHRLNSELIIARDLCQYGSLDNFALSSIVNSRSNCSNIIEDIKKKCELDNKFETQEENSDANNK